jgi:hypothetical protein
LGTVRERKQVTLLFVDDDFRIAFATESIGLTVCSRIPAFIKEKLCGTSTKKIALVLLHLITYRENRIYSLARAYFLPFFLVIPLQQRLFEEIE